MSKTLTEEQLEILNAGYPIEEDNSKMMLPRLGMLSKDITEESGTGKNKKIKIVEAAGTFYTERDLGEKNPETGKSVWTKEFMADQESIEIIIAFHRRQLRKFDASLNKFISTPIFDTAEQVVPLYLDKQVIKRGTQEELQKLYPALTAKGKPTSDLKEECILYVLFKGELFQMNISQSSKWEFKTYKKNLNPSTVITKLGTVEDSFGTNTYRKLTFTKGRTITPDEFNVVVENQMLLKEAVNNDARFFLPEATPQGMIEGQVAKENKEF